MKSTIRFILFAVHYYILDTLDWLGAYKHRLCTKHSTQAQHATFFLVNLFFLATYDAIKEWVIPFGVVGLVAVFLLSRSDW